MEFTYELAMKIYKYNEYKRIIETLEEQVKKETQEYIDLNQYKEMYIESVNNKKPEFNYIDIKGTKLSLGYKTA